MNSDNIGGTAGDGDSGVDISHDDFTDSVPCLISDRTDDSDFNSDFESVHGTNFDSLECNADDQSDRADDFPQGAVETTVDRNQGFQAPLHAPDRANDFSLVEVETTLLRDQELLAALPEYLAEFESPFRIDQEFQAALRALWVARRAARDPRLRGSETVAEALPDAALRVSREAVTERSQDNALRPFDEGVVREFQASLNHFLESRFASDGEMRDMDKELKSIMDRFIAG